MGFTEEVNREWFPLRTPPTQEQIDKNMSVAFELQHTSMIEHGKPPFASILVGPDHETVLLKHHNVSYIRHAESCLAILASDQFPPSYLWRCTMYTTWEPCPMCAGTTYWANIGRVIFAASGEQLMDVTGPKNATNFTPSGNCFEVLRGSQKDIEVLGPLPGWDRKVMVDSDWFWSTTKARTEASRL